MKPLRTLLPQIKVKVEQQRVEVGRRKGELATLHQQLATLQVIRPGRVLSPLGGRVLPRWLVMVASHRIVHNVKAEIRCRTGMPAINKASFLHS